MTDSDTDNLLDLSACAERMQRAVTKRIAERQTGPAVVIPFPERPMPHITSTVRLLRLDGTLFASAGFLPGLASAPWTWIVETVAHELDVCEDAIGTNDDDMVTVDGLPVYQVEICRDLKNVC